MNKSKIEKEYIKQEDVVESLSYKQANLKTKNKLLLEAISANLNQFQEEELENRKNKEKIEKPAKKIVLKKQSENKEEEKKEKKENYNYLENITLEELVYYLPKKEENNFQNKINRRMCYLRTLIDSYDTLLLEKDTTEEMRIYIEEARRDIESKLEYIKSYAQQKEIVKELEQLNDMKIIYFTYNDQNLVLTDLLKDDIEKYPSYLLLLNSIKEQTFKDVKRISRKTIRIYEVRYNEQRILFDILNENTIIVIQAFTKKVLSDKKYRLNLERRIVKYTSAKKEIKEEILEFLLNAEEEDRKVVELLTTKNKKRVKEKGQ